MVNENGNMAPVTPDPVHGFGAYRELEPRPGSNGTIRDQVGAIWVN